MSQYAVENGRTKHDPAVIYAYEHSKHNECRKTNVETGLD